MPVSQVLVTKFFHHLAHRQLTEAEHELEIIRLDTYFAMPGHDLDTVKQCLLHKQSADAARELDRVEKLLSDKQLTMVEREWKEFARSLGNKRLAEIKPNAEIIEQLLVNRKFADAARELDKITKLLPDEVFIAASERFQRCRQILTNKNFNEATREINILKKLLENGEFAKADRELETLKHRTQRTEWNRGYFRALFGMLLARRSNGNGSYAFFSRLDFSDAEALLDYRREFQRHVKSKLHGDFDRGFFSAWADCMRVLSKMNLANVPKVNNEAVLDKERVENLKDDQQVTMEKFLEESD